MNDFLDVFNSSALPFPTLVFSYNRIFFYPPSIQAFQVLTDFYKF
jgi:hypothetical protein